MTNFTWVGGASGSFRAREVWASGYEPDGDPIYGRPGPADSIYIGEALVRMGGARVQTISGYDCTISGGFTANELSGFAVRLQNGSATVSNVGHRDGSIYLDGYRLNCEKIETSSLHVSNSRIYTEIVAIDLPAEEILFDTSYIYTKSITIGEGYSADIIRTDIKASYEPGVARVGLVDISTHVNLVDSNIEAASINFGSIFSGNKISIYDSNIRAIFSRGIVELRGSSEITDSNIESSILSLGLGVIWTGGSLKTGNVYFDNLVGFGNCRFSDARIETASVDSTLGRSDLFISATNWRASGNFSWDGSITIENNSNIRVKGDLFIQDGISREGKLFLNSDSQMTIDGSLSAGATLGDGVSVAVGGNAGMTSLSLGAGASFSVGGYAAVTDYSGGMTSIAPTTVLGARSSLTVEKNASFSGLSFSSGAKAEIGGALDCSLNGVEMNAPSRLTVGESLGASQMTVSAAAKVSVGDDASFYGVGSRPGQPGQDGLLLVEGEQSRVFVGGALSVYGTADDGGPSDLGFALRGGAVVTAGSAAFYSISGAVQNASFTIRNGFTFSGDERDVFVVGDGGGFTAKSSLLYSAVEISGGTAAFGDTTLHSDLLVNRGGFVEFGDLTGAGVATIGAEGSLRLTGFNETVDVSFARNGSGQLFMIDRYDLMGADVVGFSKGDAIDFAGSARKVTIHGTFTADGTDIEFRRGDEILGKLHFDGDYRGDAFTLNHQTGVLYLSELIKGSRRSDILIASNGDDVINGGDGDDTLRGGLGNDTLTGGRGDDVFVFDTRPGKFNVDTITDFEPGHDKIELASSIFQGFEGGLPSFAYVDGKAQDPTGRLLYDSSTGKLSYDADGPGAGKAIVFAILANNAVLTPDDFLIA